MHLLKTVPLLLLAVSSAVAQGASPGVQFEARSAQSGKWSDPATWAGKKTPRAGESVQIIAGHTVTYDVNTENTVRVLHVAGALKFARDRSTRLNVGLLKVSPGVECNEDGFNCHDLAESLAVSGARTPKAALEIGTQENPIPAGVTAIVKLVYFEGMDTNTLPALINCGGRMDIHGAPLNRTWVKLGVTAEAGDSKVALSESVTGWRVGDHIILTVSKESEDGGNS